MIYTLLKSKIHSGTVTGAQLQYEGSISIDFSLCEKAQIFKYEKVDIYNFENGERFSTYVIYGKKGEICLNGAAARKVQIGDSIIIASYIQLTKKEISNHKPTILVLTKKNQIKSINSKNK